MVKPNKSETNTKDIRIFEKILTSANIIGLLYLYKVYFVFNYFLLSFPISLIIADFLSGILHWFGDSYHHPKLENFFDNFKNHHVKPSSIYVANTIWYNISKTTFTIYPAYIILTYCNNSTYIQNITLHITFLLFITNYLHRLAHLQQSKKMPKIMDFVMNNWFLLNAKKHALHHEYPQVKSYCITSGILNPYLDYIKFWDKLEYIIFHFTGIKSEFYDIKFPNKN